MEFNCAMHWLELGDSRRRIIMNLHQPSTAKQLARKHSIDRDACSRTLADLKLYRLVSCLNPAARRSRLYWITRLGLRCQRALRKTCGLDAIEGNLPLIDWSLYGWICFSHRASILTAMQGTMQPPEIKRRARQLDEGLSMSVNNVRDIMRLFLARGITVSVRIRNKTHLRYELSESGKQLRELLLRA